MNARSIFIIILLLFLTANICKADDIKSQDIFSQATTLSETSRAQILERYKKNIRGVVEFQDLLMAKYLKKYTLYRINVFNPVSHIAGRAIMYYSCSVDENDTLFFMDKQEDIISFLEKNVKMDELDSNSALDIAYLYSRIRRIDILQSKEDYKKRYYIKKLSEKEDLIETPCVSKEGNGYRIELYAVTDPNISLIEKINITVSGSNIKVHEKFLCTRNYYD
ncbi:MAG: hypothetical protein KKH98_10845 [Spirochaetes bacterium]|nr:hypothetical protein [Spirochaetota bacterium]